MPDNSEVDSAEIRALAAGQTRIETALTTLSDTVSRKFDELGTRYVPREELTQRFTGITDHQLRQDDRILVLETGREVDQAALETRAARFEERLRSDRQSARVVLVSLLGVVVLILSIVIAHWR